jgi:hypothetical protein
VHDERVEVVGETLGGRAVAGTVELVDQGPESLLSVVLSDVLCEVGVTDAALSGRERPS